MIRRRALSNYVASRQCGYGKLEKQPVWLLWDHPRRLLIRHCTSKSGMFHLLCHVIVVNVEHHMLPQLSLSRSWGREPILL